MWWICTLPTGADFVAMAEKRGWIVVLIPGGCTSEVQDHDLVVNKALKDDLRRRHEKLCPTRGEVMKPPRSDICAWVAQGSVRWDDGSGDE